MADDHKLRRRTAKAQYTRAERRLKEALDNADNIPVSTVARRFEDLNARWNMVQETHDVYVASLPPPLEGEEDVSVTEEAWIDELVDRFSLVEVQVDRVMEEIEKRNLQVKVPKNADGMHAKSEETLVSNVENGTVDAASEASAMNITTSSAVSTLTNNVVQSSAAPANCHPVQPFSPIALQLERIKLSKFNGDIRKYPKFREQFELYVKPMCAISQLPFLLRSHLENDVQEEVENVEDNMEALWRRLDIKYGNRSKYVDTILADIAKAPRGDGKTTLQLIKTVEKAHRDLTRIQAAEEMHNGTIISMIERKLPEEIRFVWIKTIASRTNEGSSDRFKLLLAFMEEWKAMIEYDEAAIRRTPEKNVFTHHAI